LSPSSTDEADESSTSHEPERDHRAFSSASETDVLVCGASVRSLAESLLAVGRRPLCVDFFGDRDLLQLLETQGGVYLGAISGFHQLPEMVKLVPADTPMIWTGGLENEPEILESIARQRRVCGVSPEFVRKVRNPEDLDELVRDTILKRPARLPLRQAASQPEPNKWLLKTRKSGGGLGVRRLAPGESAPGESLDGVAESSAWAEQFVSGANASVLVWGDGRGQAQLIGTSLLLSGVPELGAEGFQYCGNIGPIQHPGAMHLDVEKAVKTLASRTFFGGMIGLDLVVNSETAFLLEVNPRLTASYWLYEQNSPGSLVERLLAGGDWKERAISGVRSGRGASGALGLQLVVWNREPRTAPFLSNEGLPVGFRLADLPFPGTQLGANVPLCSIIGTTETVAQMIASAAEISSLVPELGVEGSALTGFLDRTVAEARKFCTFEVR
jgi:predicted ATP-grasp superfamily ATP-dependent carboligase